MSLFNFKQSSLFFHTSYVFLFFYYITLAQTKTSKADHQYTDYYTFLFYNESAQRIPKGKIMLPGTYPEFNYDLKTNLISFETTFNLNYPNATTNLIFDKGFSDEGMVLINGEFIDSKVIKGKDGYTCKIPSSLLREGINKITLLNIFHSPLWEFEGDLYIENGLEKVILNGYWDFMRHKNLETNFQRKPTQGLDVFDFLDLNLKSYFNSKIASEWSKTDFPIEIESLYNNELLNGVFCFKKKVTFDKPPNEDFYFIIDKGIDDTDRLYINGKLVGSTDCFNCKRLYRIPYTYLNQQNDFTLFVADKNGPGGVMDRIFLKNKSTVIDISNQWSYNKLSELQIIVTSKNTQAQNSFFEKADFKFYNLDGKEINFDNLILENKNLLTLPLVLILIAGLSFVFFIFYVIRKQNISNSKIERVLPIDDSKEHLFIRSDRADHKIFLRDIVSIEGKKDYVKIQLDSKSYLVRKNLKTFLIQLPTTKFIRISKSVAINLDKISKIENNIIFLSIGSYHVISKNYVKNINQLLIN